MSLPARIAIGTLVALAALSVLALLVTGNAGNLAPVPAAHTCEARWSATPGDLRAGTTRERWIAACEAGMAYNDR